MKDYQKEYRKNMTDEQKQKYKVTNEQKQNYKDHWKEYRKKND